MSLDSSVWAEARPRFEEHTVERPATYLHNGCAPQKGRKKWQSSVVLLVVVVVVVVVVVFFFFFVVSLVELTPVARRSPSLFSPVQPGLSAVCSVSLFLLCLFHTVCTSSLFSFLLFYSSYLLLGRLLGPLERVCVV